MCLIFFFLLRFFFFFFFFFFWGGGGINPLKFKTALFCHCGGTRQRSKWRLLRLLRLANPEKEHCLPYFTTHFSLPSTKQPRPLVGLEDVHILSSVCLWPMSEKTHLWPMSEWTQLRPTSERAQDWSAQNHNHHCPLSFNAVEEYVL